MKQPIYTTDPYKEKQVLAGELEEGVFIKKVTPEIHLFRLWNCYGIQETVIIKLQTLSCHTIKIIEKNGYTLISTFNDWLDPRIKVTDFGGGRQRFYPRKDMIKETTIKKEK